ncbi:MAG TPA: hypothetical protein VMU32_05620 [Solirubrobacteraceae bacterium]|nr:hypothetical protein [Solirubrobacteraceae bacterium]
MAIAALTLLLLLMCLSHILHGGLVADDWAYRALAHFGGFSGVVSQQIQQDVRRPLAAVYFATLFTTLGPHLKLLLAWSAGLRLIVAILAYTILRQLQFAKFAALALACLVMLFPFSDSTWLWPTASVLTFALACALFGRALNLSTMSRNVHYRALRRILGLSFLAAGILSYELVAPLCCAFGSLYLLRTHKRRALFEWALDLAVLIVIMMVFTLHVVPVLHGQDVHEISDLAQMRQHLGVMTTQSANLVTQSLVPFGSPDNALVLGILGVLVATALVVVARAHVPDQHRRSLIVALAVAGAGVIVVILGYLPLIPANIYYVPLQPGIGNRVNAVAAIGYVLILYGAVSLISTLPLWRPRRRLHRQLLSALILVAVGIGYLHIVDSHRSAWRQSVILQETVLDDLRTHIPPPAHGAGILTINAPLETAPGVSVFDSSWDLNGAVQMLWNDPSLRALPILPAMTIVCLDSGLYVNSGPVLRSWQSSYPTYVLDVATDAVYTLDSRATCTSAAKALGILADDTR